jgi:transposase
MEKVTTLGIDLAKSVFSLHGVDGGGAGGAATYGATRSAGEGGSGYSALSDRHGGVFGAHEWGRRFQEHGHAVRLMALEFVALEITDGQRWAKPADGRPVD